MPRAATIRKPLDENQSLPPGFCFSDTRFAPHNPYASGSPTLIPLTHLELLMWTNRWKTTKTERNSHQFARFLRDFP